MNKGDSGALGHSRNTTLNDAFQRRLRSLALVAYEISL